MNKRRKILTVVLLVVVLARFIPHAGELYARYLYPAISGTLSALFSVIPFSLDEWIVIAAVIFIMAYPFYGHRHGRNVKSIACVEIEALLWMVAWFYIGWGINYYRDSFFIRARVQQENVEKKAFCQFLNNYTDSLNASFVESNDINKDSVMSRIKSAYTLVPERFGLSLPKDWQQPKWVAFNALYSAVGVHGYMGPFAEGSQLNTLLSAVEYPFTYAHELAHLLSISSEAEANYWAYQVCTGCPDRLIRYSGYYSILPNIVRNARQILTKAEYDKWLRHIDRRILNEQEQRRQFWYSHYSPLVADVQHLMFNMLLKGNNIPDGTVNYDKVIAFIIACPKPLK